MPKELKRAYYHQWGLKKQDYSNVDAPSTRGMTWGLKKQEDPSAKTIAKGQTYYGLIDTVKLLGHEKLDVIDIFKIDCELNRLIVLSIPTGLTGSQRVYLFCAVFMISFINTYLGNDVSYMMI